MQLTIQEKTGFLKDEYLFLQAQYEDYDKRSLTIKGWVASGSAAALAISFDSSHRNALIIPIIVMSISASFWYLESYWKLFQYAFADRIVLIESYFRGDIAEIEEATPFQIYRSWLYSYSSGSAHASRLKKAAMHRFVAIPYVVIIFLSLVSVALLAATAA